MAWSPTFLSYLEEAGPHKPIIKVVRHQFDDWGNFSPTYTAVTHPAFATTPEQYILDGSFRMNGYALNSQTWVTSGGGFSFMVGSAPFAYLTRGHVLRVYWGFDVFDPDDMELLDWGVVTDITGHGGVKLPTGTMSAGPWTIQCAGFFAALQNRPSTGAKSSVLFYDSSNFTSGGQIGLDGSASNVAGNYTAGDPTLQVADATGFSRETGAPGAVKVYDDFGSGTYFYGTYTGISGGDTFTGFDGTTYFTSGGGFDINISSATGYVEEVPLLKGHPSEIYRRILASTGAGGNGDYDDYPEGWGLGIGDFYIDNDDCDDWLTESDASAGGTDISIIPDPPPSNALQWLIGLFSPGGWFPVIRQGLFSFRCALDPDDSMWEDIEITDADIEDSPTAITFQGFSEDSPVLYSHVQVNTAVIHDGTAVGTVTAQPSAPEWRITYDTITTTGAIDDSNGNEQEQIDKLIERLAIWYQRIPMKITLQCVGYRLFQLAIGSRVTLTSGQDSSGTFGRITERDGTVPRERNALVVGLRPDVMGGRIQVTLAVMPEFDTEVP